MSKAVEEKMRRKLSSEHVEASQSKRQRVEEGLLTFGGTRTDEIPLLDWKVALDRSLPQLKLTLKDNITPSKKPGINPSVVQFQPIKRKVMRIHDNLTSAPMPIAPVVDVDLTPIESESAGNAALKTWVFDVVNKILALWPGDPYLKRWRLVMNPTRSTATEYASTWYHANKPEDEPDARCQLVYSEDGTMKALKQTALDLEGKQWPIFWANQSEDVRRSGVLDLAKAFNEKTLSADGVHALAQCCRYLFDDRLEYVILFTPAVLWVIRCSDRELKNITISEPITASDTDPSMKQVVFGVVFHQILAAKERLRKEVMPDWLITAMEEPPCVGGPDDAAAASSEELGAIGNETMGDELLGGKTGDELLSELNDTEPALYGNSVVRIGRLGGMKVAAKLVSCDAPKWIQDEIENECKKLDLLKALQGSVVPEKVFAGKVNSGKDRLLITKFVEGDYIVKAPKTSCVADNARKALEAIHYMGFLHGDVSPRNILVKKTGECMLLDLGRAKRAETEHEKKMEMGELEIWL